MDQLRDLAASIDHTLLAPAATSPAIVRLCEEAAREGFAAVCVNARWVPLAAATLRNTAVPIAAVVGFPLGATATDVKVAETLWVLDHGAGEIDMVLSLGDLKAGDDDAVVRDIAAVVDAAAPREAPVKVILETCLLEETEKERAVACAVAAGAAFVKTSTGFSSGGATVEDVALMRRLAPHHVGVKASGGIRSLATARAMLAAGANRLGTSSGVKIIAEAREWFGSH